MGNFPLSSSFGSALLFALRKHGAQTRSGGEPYLLHPLRVARSLKDPDLKVIAVLHDTVEDTSATVEEIEQLFGPRTARAVNALTRRDGEPYQAYIARVAINHDAALVKMADIFDNLSDTPSDRAILKSLDALATLTKVI